MDFMTVFYYTIQSAIVVATVVGCYFIIKG